MPEYVMDQGSSVGIYLVGTYPDPSAADTYANSIGVFGTPVERGAWEAAPSVTNVELDYAKFLKLIELTKEGNSRCSAVTPFATDVRAAALLDLAVKNNSLESVGKDLADVGAAYDAATLVILAFTNINDVINYDVVNDPLWP